MRWTEARIWILALVYWYLIWGTLRMSGVEDGSQGAKSGEIEPLFDVPGCFPLDVLKSGLIDGIG